MLIFSIILTLIKIIAIISETDLNKFDLFNPIPFTLYNDNIIIFSNLGFHTFDSNYLLLYNFTFNESINIFSISNYEDIKYYYPSFIQFPEEEGGYVLILFLKYLYYFDNSGKFLKQIDLEDISYIDTTLSSNFEMKYYKNENSENYYIILVIDFQGDYYYGKINYYYYKINISGDNILIYNNTYLNVNEQIAVTSGLTCGKTISNISKSYITCFYEYTKNSKNVIGEITFDPDNSFNYIEDRKYIETLDTNRFINGVSATNGDNSKIYVCYTSYGLSILCFYFDINSRELSKLYKFGDNCKNNLFSININYFIKNDEFIVSCINKVGNGFFISKFKENIDFVSPSFNGNFSKLEDSCFESKTCSVLFSNKYDKYFLFTYNKCYLLSLNFETRIYELTNFFNISINKSLSSSIDNYEDNIKTENTEEMNIDETTEIYETNKITETNEITETNKVNEKNEVSETNEVGKTNEITETNDVSKINEVSETNEITETNILSEINEITETNKISETNGKTNKLTEEIIETEKNNDAEEINDSIQDTIKKEYCKDHKQIKNSEGECICDNSNDYYPIKYENTIFNAQCYNKETKPNNFFFNKKNNIFEICYKNCQSCNDNGNDNENNCTSCINNYIFIPDVDNTTNCVPKCNYYYYFSLYKIYSCTTYFKCPEEAKFLIRNKNKCIDSCSKDKIYKYQYSGECLEKCPDDMNVNVFKCEIKNINSCSLSIFELNLTIDEVETINMDYFSKNYVEEFNYTNNQIINYTNEEYSLIIYKNSSCIRELSLTIPTIDFGECYEKIKLAYNISEELVVSILDKHLKNGNSKISYLLFNPTNGEKFNSNEICKNETIVIKENIFSIPGINYSLVQYFAEQDINVFDLKDKFYTDICKHYKSPNGKDIPLKLRFQVIFPNVSLCEQNCISKGVDLKTMESICYCPFTDFQNSIISKVFEYSETLGDIYSFVSNSNIDVLFCIKHIFSFEYLKRCIGGFIVIGLIIFQTICVLIYFLKSKSGIEIYIYELFDIYTKSLKSQLNMQPPKKGKRSENKIEINNNMKNIPSQSQSLIIAKNINYIKINDEKSLKKKIQKKKIKNKHIVTYFPKSINKINFKNIPHQKNINDTQRLNNNSARDINKIQINEYLSTDPNELDFEDIIEKDKRTFLEYFFESIKERQLLINSFIIKDSIKPNSIKIIAFLLTILFCLLINGLMYTEEYLSDLYKVSGKEKFLDFISRSISRLIYSFVIIKVLIELIDCFFIEERKLKRIFIRGKNNITNIKREILILIKRIVKYNFVFIIISYIIFIFSWIYISCFNDVYYYTRKDWIKSSLFLIIIYQIYPIILCITESIVRYISIKFKSEKVFKLSQFMS